MQDLIDTLKIVQERIEKHKENLKRNETLTRYALIDPLLRALDWQLDDPSIVVPEEKINNKLTADYSFGDKIMILEAKSLSTILENYVEKLKLYMSNSNHMSVYGVLTNGSQWKTYHLVGQKLTHLNEFNVTDSLETIIPKIVLLHRQVIISASENECTRCDSVFDNKKDLSVHISKVHATVIEETNNITRLLGYEYVPGSEPPKELIIYDENIKITKWTHILKEVSRYLIKNKHITTSDCPFPKSGNCIINTKPIHESGIKFRAKEKVNNFYVELNVNPETSIKNSIKLIKHAVGVDLSKFKLQF